MTTDINIPTSLENDLLFKEAFAHPDNRDILIYFLSCFTNFSIDYLNSVNINVNYESPLLKSKVNDKTYRSDIIISFENYIIDLECYSSFNNFDFDKSLVYVLRIYSTIMEAGSNYSSLKQVKGINFIDNVAKNAFMKDKVYSKVLLIYEDIPLDNVVNLEFYRIDKARLENYNKNNKKNIWLKFIGAKDYTERKKIAEGDERLMTFNEWLEKYINDEHTREFFGKWAEKIAYDKGVEAGEESGLMEGAKLTQQEIVKKMLQSNYDEATIHKLTNLPIKEIRALKDENHN